LCYGPIRATTGTRTRAQRIDNPPATPVASGDMCAFHALDGVVTVFQSFANPLRFLVQGRSPVEVVPPRVRHAPA